MKNIIKLVSLVVLMILLAACGTTKPEVTTFEKTQGEQLGTVQVTHTGDTVDKVNMNIIIKFPQNDTITKELIQASLDGVIQNTGKVKGMKLSGNAEDNQLTLNIDIDFHEIDWKQFQQTQFGAMIGNTKEQEANKISYEEFKKDLIKQGFVEKK